jgi:S-adenosylmethionine/arginine decarboxylase-like enzyme
VGGDRALVDISACGDGDMLAAANQIADRILAKVPQ